MLTDNGPLRLDIPRDRDGSFAPILVPKHERRLTGFDDKIVAMYAHGMTVREILGMADILIVVTDGLKGMPDALEAVFPATTLQTCIVHLIRNSMKYASWQDRNKLGSALHPIYSAIKLLWLAIRNITVKWGKATHHWTAALQQFATLYQERFTRTYTYLIWTQRPDGTRQNV